MITKETRKSKLRQFQRFTKYAAVFAIILSAGYFYWNGAFAKKEQLKIPQHDITLQLSDGEVKILNQEEEKEVKSKDGTTLGLQKGKTLNYTHSKEQQALVYNELKVPNGKRFQVILSDSTKVLLNSGSSIKFPVKFLKGFDRKVFITGEAYFNVVKDENHPFIVVAQDVDIKVYGTKFNVTTYPEDNNTNIVLVEGSVGMYANTNAVQKEQPIILKPGTMGIFQKDNKQITTQNVNTHIYTSWINGNVIFREVTFKNISAKLERLYNVTIINNNKKIALEKFNASIDVDSESIEKVLDFFSKVYAIEYQVVNNKIVIK